MSFNIDGKINFKHSCLTQEKLLKMVRRLWFYQSLLIFSSLSWSSLIYEAHDSTLSHIWDCEKHKNWTLSIIKTVLISSETFMTARIKYHEPEVWWDVMPTFLFLPSHNVCSGSRCSTWDGSQGQIGHNGGLSVWLPHFTPFYRLARNAQSSVKLTPLQSVNRGQDLWVSSIINEAEEMPFLQGSYWTFFDNWRDIQLWLWTSNSAVTTSQMPFNKEMGLKIF